MHKRKFYGLMLLLLSVFSLTGCGGGGGSSNPIAANPSLLGNVVLEGYVSNAPISGSIRASAKNTLTLPMIGAVIQAGEYDSAGNFAPYTGVEGLTDATGKYSIIIPALKKARRNIIIRARLLNAVLEAVMPQLPESGTGIAPIIDENTLKQAKLMREIAMKKAVMALGDGYDVNLADVLSRIPPDVLAGLTPNDLATIADTFLQREKARKNFANALPAGGEKIEQLRNFGFEQSRKIIEGIEAGIYSREEGWRLFDEMMRLQAITLGLPPYVIKMLSDIDASVNNSLADDFPGTGFPGDELTLEAELRKFAETAEMFKTAIEAFKGFRKNNVLLLSDDEIANIKLELGRLIETIKFARNPDSVAQFFHRHPLFAFSQGQMNRLFKGLGLFDAVDNNGILLKLLFDSSQGPIDPGNPYQTMEYRIAEKSDIINNINTHLAGLNLTLLQIEALANLLLAYRDLGFSMFGDDDAPPPINDDDMPVYRGEIMGVVSALNPVVVLNDKTYDYKITMPEQFATAEENNDGLWAYARLGQNFQPVLPGTLKVFSCVYEKPFINQAGVKVPCVELLEELQGPPPVITLPVEPGNVFYGLFQKNNGKFSISLDGTGNNFVSGSGISIEFYGDDNMDLDSFVNKYVKIEGTVVARLSANDFTPTKVKIIQIDIASFKNISPPGYSEGSAEPR